MDNPSGSKIVSPADHLKSVFTQRAHDLSEHLSIANECVAFAKDAAPVERWLATPALAGDKRAPHEALDEAAFVASAYATGGVEQQRAVQLYTVLEASRKALGVALVGRELSDGELRTNPEISAPARAFAAVLVEACRVVNDICDDGSLDAGAARETGRPLSTRQIVQMLTGGRDKPRAG